MGLAASQCRFLMLTSRESDIEAKLMMLSNQQMSLAQRSSKLSSDFAKLMSEQTLNFGGNPVSYSDIMHENLTADTDGNISQYIFKTARGSVVLSPGLASKLNMLPSSDNMKNSFGKACYGGSSADFKELYPSRADFIKLATNVEVLETTSKDAAGNTITSTIQQAGYKYNDNIMNQAVVSVQSASVLALSGYGFEELEYAMGTQEDKLSAYACIWTLDQYQYTESNVHSIVNLFVNEATNKMSEVMLSPDNLGDSDAVKYATNYAIEKTKQYYADRQVESWDKDINAVLSELSQKRTGSQATSLSNTNIIVSAKTTDVTTTTEVDTSGSPSLEIQHLTGKDVFIDTAQLTAVYLNFFDAGMIHAMADAKKSNVISSNGLEDEKYMSKLLEIADKIEDYNVTACNDTSSTGSDKFSPLLARLNAQNQNGGIKLQVVKTDSEGYPLLDDDGNPITEEKSYKGTEGVGGFNYYLHDYVDVKQTDDDGNPIYTTVDGKRVQEVKSRDNGLKISSETGTTGWLGDTAQTNKDESVTSSTLVAQQNFYGFLYDAMASGGWAYNQTVASDDDYLDKQLQHGNIYLCQYSSHCTKGKNLSIDDATSGFSLVDNSKVIEKAQADFEAETAKLDYKTNIISTQMNTLQTELDSIQQEKESVKSITDKHLEKRFNIFS